VIPTTRYIKLLTGLFKTRRTREIFRINPTRESLRQEPEQISISVYDYSNDHIDVKDLNDARQCVDLKENGNISWINIDGIRKADVDYLSSLFNIHYLVTEDIMSVGQRPKMDEIEGQLFCLLNMLYYNEREDAVESEQVSIILGPDYVLSFQEDPKRDVFNQIREKLKLNGSKLRTGKADYLCYSLLDCIVDHYYLVLEKLGDRIELLEEEIIRHGNNRSLAHINNLRKELIVLKRNIAPVREVINGFIRSESALLEDRTTKYFKDIYDHIVQASDLVENYRDMIMTLQDLYLNKVNLKMNEVMKVMTIVTCLLAPATVIGGIFGMNFSVIPLSHQETGFYWAVSFMMAIPLIMIFIFRKRGWF
jgi:magnesium transporter